MIRPTDENEYDDENEDTCNSDEYEELVEVVEVIPEDKPLTYVLGKPIVNNKASKMKRPIIFKGTKNGWTSCSFVQGFTNDYVSNETWDFIEDQWLRCDLKNIEVFWEEEEFLERIKEMNNSDYYNYSEAYKNYGYDLEKEVDILKEKLGITL